MYCKRLSPFTLQNMVNSNYMPYKYLTLYCGGSSFSHFSTDLTPLTSWVSNLTVFTAPCRTIFLGAVVLVVSCVPARLEARLSEEYRGRFV